MLTNIYNLSKNNKGFICFLLIVLAFIAPIVLAHICYKYLPIAGGVTNQGTLIKNPANISELTLNTQFAAEVAVNNTDAWQEQRWRIIYLMPEACLEQCQNIIYRLQQVHISLGKNINRLQRLNIYQRDTPYNYDNLQSIYNKYQHITIASIDTTQTNTHNNTQSLDPANIYLADPYGNIILSYKISDSDFDKKILKDTKKLLNISKIG